MRNLIGKAILCSLCIISPAAVYADIYALNPKEIPNYNTLALQYDYLYNNLRYYHFWTAKWTFDSPKADVQNNLMKLYNDLGAIQASVKPNIELELMMGEIAQFLFNLELNEYYQKALVHYAKAETIKKEDYRPHWFAARLLTLAAHPKESIVKFNEVAALTNDPLKLHPNFWEEFAYSAATAYMPSTALMCIDISNKITGKDSPYNQIAGNKIRSSIISVPVKKKIEDKKQWQIIPEENVYINRLFGFRVTTIPGWSIIPQKSDKKILSSFILSAPAEKGNTGDVPYRFSFIAKTPEKNETLQTMIDNILAPYKNNTIKPIELTNPYESSSAYEVIIPSVNVKEGGGHYILFAMERDNPAYPGVGVEFPTLPSRNKSGMIEYTPQKPVFARYNGKIYYFLLMDTSESIFQQSKANMENLLNHMIIIE